eukprot:TRINITY_DN1700_c0_g1_i5.p1 TRINITY_DN1700_c0_g1~~TRINITY_DN1700_c0_g1_i5.p1  ORF type:complete len:343 (+),score=60.84 TRINITY_DN1700_c0_g1_i5:139-1029(+)
MRSFIIVLLFLPAILALRNSRCHLLAFEGGGTKGAYQAGAFESLVKFLPPKEVRYNVITGVSVGALNGLMVAMHKVGQEKTAAGKLIDLWLNVKSGDMYEHWPFPGPLRGFFYKPSFLDNSPEIKFVTRKFEEHGSRLQRRFTFGITDAQTGKYFAVNQSIEASKVPHYVVASTSVPGIFKYLPEGNKVLIDGFAVNNLNLRKGIEECKKIVSDDSQIVADIVLTNPISMQKYNMSEYGSLGMYFRGRELSTMRQSFYYLFDTIRGFPKVRWRYVISPKEALPNYPFVPLVKCCCR